MTLTEKVAFQMEVCRDALKKEMRELEESIYHIEWDLRAKEARLEYCKESLEELEEFMNGIAE